MKDAGTKKLTVGIVFGGQSGEHEVSIKSASSIIAAMDPDRYTVVPLGITRQGRWIPGMDAFRVLNHAADPNLLGRPEKIPEWVEKQPELALLSGSGEGLFPDAGILQGVDIFFPVLHGTFGEDGTIQGMFEMMHSPYVGCGVLASALAMDKISFKEVMLAHRIPSTPYLPVNRADWRCDPDRVIATVEKTLGYPVFTKPANLGSSVGIAKCTSRDTLRSGLRLAAEYDRRIIVEKAVANAREIEVSVLGNDQPEASVPGEILPSREFYDYSAKYIDEGDNASGLLIPAPLSPGQITDCQELAVRAFRVIDGAGMARVDFLMDARSGELILNEINTIPGFTSISMYPKLWAASGLPYSQLIDRLIQLGLTRAADRRDLQFTA